MTLKGKGNVKRTTCGIKAGFSLSKSTKKKGAIEENWLDKGLPGE